jgi:dipeptidyl aminopeptidase/acylaminoacyl peptidase
MNEHEGESYIWLFSLENGTKKPLVPVYESHYFMGHLSVKDFGWSPDGAKIAYISTGAFISATTTSDAKVIDRLLYKTKGGRGRPFFTDDEVSHVWVTALDGSKPQQLTSGEYNEHSISWSPDSSKIAFISNRSGDQDNNQLHDLWSVDVASKKIVRYTENFGTTFLPSWSPDGTSIAFLATLGKVATNDSPAEDTHLYLVESNGEIRCLTKAFDRRIEQVRWHPQSKSLFFTAGNHGTTSIYNVDVATNKVEHLIGENCHILEFSLDKSGNNICYISTDTTHLTEIFLYDTSANAKRQLTGQSKHSFDNCLLQTAEAFWFKSFDDLDIQGWIIKPANFLAEQKYPLVLVIHGGPHNMFGYEFEDRMQILSAKGYGVLFINPRGSSGYGQAFSSGCVLNWGGGDYKDLMSGVDAAIEQNSWIDPNRLGVTGQSYGGYMANWIITQTNRFKAAVVDGGISNLISFAGTSLYHSLMESEFNGSAYDNFPLLWQWSPLRNVKNVSTPTLFLHGQLDNEVPVTQAEEMYIALKKLGVESKFVQYIGEGHGWRPDLKPQNRYDLLNRTIEWFDKFLMR